MLIVTPAMVAVALRGSAGFSATLNLTVASPTPLGGVAPLIHAAPL
jgi:hypothetical protein